MIPTFNFPAIFLERIIRSDLPINLQAIALRAESRFEGSQNSLIAESSCRTTFIPSLTLPNLDTNSATHEKNNVSIGEEFKKSFVKAAFGPLSPATSDLNSNWGVFGKVCSLDRPCVVDEVHLRRFDGLLVTKNSPLKFIFGRHFYLSCCTKKSCFPVGKWWCSSLCCR